MKNHAKILLATVASICLIPAAAFALVPYSQDFEALNANDLDALADDGWLVFGNVFDGVSGDYMYGYGPFPAPNNPGLPAFSNIITGQGGDEQGAQQLSVFSDYENGDHGNGHLIESIVYREQIIGLGDVGSAWVFEFQAKKGNFAGNSTATAFIKTLDPINGYITTNYIRRDMTWIPETWGGGRLILNIDVSLVGQLFQIGFANIASNYEPSAIIYDNVVLREEDPLPVPDSATIVGAALGQNYPNPFNPKTRIDFSLEQPGNVDITIFDMSGRQVANLHHGELAGGDHHVTWNGMTATGSPAPAGQYRYVMKTAAGQVSRSMVLLK